MSTRLTAIALVSAGLLGACATSPAPPPADLAQARSVVHSAELDPGVLSNAPLELKRATDALARADTLWAKREPLSEVSSAAYVADREARAAVAIAQAKRNEQSIQGAELDREQARADAKTTEARQAQSAAIAAQMQAGAARDQAAAAEQRADSAQVAAADAQQQNAELQQRLSELQAKETDRGLLVTLGDVLFEFNRAEIKPSAQGSLHKLADFLQQHPERRVLIEGYTDNVGAVAYNTTLSQRRAEAVARALAGMGVGPERINSVGYGKDYPIADNSTDTNRALNRRVEVYISDDNRPVRSRG